MLIFTELHQMEILQLSPWVAPNGETQRGGLRTKKFHFLDIYEIEKNVDSKKSTYFGQKCVKNGLKY